ncbi:carbamoyltransferase C-terminal domain-containing protein [Burkholderia vietnamiensis]|uniref:carbamoyltransferase C-terminal domain-containing protein n=1 Tax=Burkholderia vietnamiensis TaxID=60552 RepID=UPI0009BFCC18|nr:carbamoyltransferase C-terminal domain-containing protein [Burkholderia vietnamiensis]
MANISLGIHVGHDSACAVVADGKVLAATQQERHTRRKHDGHVALNSALPIAEVLAIAGISIADVTTIVTSYQAVCPGGVGLRYPMWTPEFDVFDPFDPRHFAVSHHQAHAMSAFGASGFESAACLVCDLGGSTTLDGEDYYVPFDDFYREVTRVGVAGQLKTENLSYYSIGQNGPKLIEREFAQSSSVGHVFVSGLASLYDNASRHVFGSHDAHGQLMALASLRDEGAAISCLLDDLIEIDDEFRVTYKNGWQSCTPRFNAPTAAVGFARLVQDCFTAAVQAYSTRLKHLTQEQKATFAGGVFLNIIGNSAIAESGLFSDNYFPSVPNDSGIALGCAYIGQIKREQPVWTHRMALSNDRLGRHIDNSAVEKAISQTVPFIVNRGQQSAKSIAQNISEGKIYARCSGRSEFGPRALGGRSILSSPLFASSKQRTNAIKGRQPWRPVAPIVLEERFGDFFDGVCPSPFMNLVHRVKDQARSLLGLEHPDGSTRVQTLKREDDPELYQIIYELGEVTGFPIILNTSLNGPAEPMIETAVDAIGFFRQNPDVDRLLLDRFEIARHPDPLSVIHPNTVVHTAPSLIVARARHGRGWIVGSGGRSTTVSVGVFLILEAAFTPTKYCCLLGEINGLSRIDRDCVRDCFDLGILKFMAPGIEEARNESSSSLDVAG